ncbi:MULTISPECIES: hypothetical protein [Pseudomonas syringae group]|uniref:Uncharacterized protein n=1 Tax=Pseudomonas meliae TaxID=86176 RepID=A0A0P9UUM4_9PSED|nr:MULTISPECIES: hypothetical protein [Pseudomonas syringae group]KPX92693.1 Unknown protein sequence [Pseudomonas meliae]QOU99714.1 hypothetical protein [Pseudomonas syringae pv. actinidiae]
MKITFLVVALSVVAAFTLLLNSEAKEKAQRQARVDAKCAAEAENPPPPFKSSLVCVGWTHKSDLPLPPQG